MTYEVHGTNRSRAFRVLWALEEIGVEYTHMITMPRSPEILALNPLGKLPAMRVGDVALTDSTAIMTYLADVHGELTYPAGTLERAKQDGHTQFLLDELDSLLWTASKHTFGLPEEIRMPAIKESLKEEFRTSCDRLAARIEGPFIMGEKMTIPDIIAVHCMGWALVAKFPLERADLKAYSKPIRARDAYTRTQALG